MVESVKAPWLNKSGAGVDLDATVFGAKFNEGLVHECVRAEQNARRRGTAASRTRAQVRGGGAKPWRQKGTGRARQGSTRAPHWQGGGVAMGPKPRDYTQKTPKKMVQLALRSALSDRAAEGKVAVVDAWDFAAPKTREAKEALQALGLTGKVLVVLDRDDLAAFKSFRNMPDVHPILNTELNAYDILCCDWLVFTRVTLPSAGEAVPAPAPEPAASSENAVPAAASEPAPAEEQA